MPYSAGTAYLTVVPSFVNIREAFDREARQLGRSFDQAMRRTVPDSIQSAVREGGRNAEREGGRAGDQFGGAFRNTMERHLKRAQEAAGDFRINADTRGAERALADLRERVSDMREVHIGVDVDEGEAVAELVAIREAAEALDREDVSIEVRTNARQVAAEVAAALKFLEDNNQASVARRAQQGTQEGTAFGGAYGRAARKAITAALASLPVVELNADSSDAQREIFEIRRELAAMSDLEIGVDIDAGTAQARLDRLQARLRELSSQDLEVQAHVDVLAAMAALEAFKKQVDRLDGRQIDVKVDSHQAASGLKDFANEIGISMSRMGFLLSLGASLGPVIVPAAATAAAAVGAIGVAAGAAGLGIGTLFLGFNGVFQAVSALNKAQQDSAKSGISLQQSQDRVANAIDGVRSAERSLEQTRESVARGARDAARAVVAAERDVVDAEKEAADAVRDLARAQREAQEAEQDRAFDARKNALDQQQAVLDLAEAQKDLDKILSNPRATEAERQQAKITFEQRKLQLEELGVTGKRIQEEQERVAKEGADNVNAAQERVAKTTQAVADAQEKLARAIESQTEQQRDGARQLAGAQESLARANRALAQAYDKTGVAGGAAFDNVRKAMEALSPAGRKFALFLFGLKPAFDRLSAAAQAGLLPGVEKAIRSLLPVFPALEKVVTDVAQALGDGFVMWADAMRDPVFVQFFSYLGQTAAPILRGITEFAINVTKGIFGIINALSGFNGPIGNGLLKWSEGFANWSATLSDNKGWRSFLDYVKRVGPKVVDLFAGIWDFTVKLVAAAAPIGEVLVDALDRMFEFLASLDPKTLTIIVATLGGIAAALLVVAGITSILATGVAGAIVIAVGAVAAGLAILYNKVKPFRVFVDTTIKAIATAAQWLYQRVFLPVFEGISHGIAVWKMIFQDLYDTIFVHVFGLIAAVFNGLWETAKTVFEQFDGAFGGFRSIAQTVFSLFQAYTKNAGAGFSWLWEHILKPVFGFIGAAFEVFKAIFQVVFGLFQIGIKIAGNVFRFFWENQVRPIFNLLKPVFQWLGDVITKYVVPPFKEGMKKLGEAWNFLVDLAKNPIKFLVDVVLNQGLLAGYNKIAKFFKVKPDDVHIDLPKGFARGGPIRGRGRKGVDSQLIYAAPGEHMWTAQEVDALGGHGAVEALRAAALHGTIPGFARGGGVGDGIGSWLAGLRKKATDAYTSVKDFFADPMGALRKLGDKLFDLIPYKDSQAVQSVIGAGKAGLQMLVDKVKNLFGSADRPTGVTPGGLGYQRMETILRAAFPAISFFSDYRPGSITSTGNLSYHAVGRAVDMTPSQTVFNWIASHFPDSRELIFSPMGDRQIHNGQPHFYGEPVRSEHFDHVHWAYDSGGMLPRGWSLAYNGTSSPEPVLTASQWDNIGSLAAGGNTRPGNVYNFEFADTTLTPGKLRAIQDRDALLNREGRAR